MDLSLIPIFVLLPITMISSLTFGVSRNFYCKDFSVSNSGRFLFNSIISIICAIIIFAFSGFNLSASTFTILTGVAFGIVTVFSTVLYLVAVSIGPWSYSSVLVSSSTIITAIVGTIIWQESINLFTIFGIIFMVVCILLSTKKKDGEKNSASFKWLLFCVLAALASSGVGLLQKTHQTSSFKLELFPFLTIAFFVSAIVSFICFLILRNKQPLFSTSERTENLSRKKFIGFIVLIFILAGITFAFNNIINLYLSGVMPSAVFFPIVNGGGLVLATITSIFLFKEKLSKLQWIGISSGIIAILFLCI